MQFARKNQIAPLLFLLSLTLLPFSACKKDPQEIAALLSNSEAAEIIQNALATQSGGFTAPTIDIAQMLENLLDDCGTPGDTTYSKSKNGGTTSYTYAWEFDWLLTCTALGIPQSAAFDIVGDGDFTSTRWTGSDLTSGELAFTGLDLQTPEYTVNGTYQLDGNVTGNLRKVTPSMDVSTELHLTDLKISKTTYAITGGSGTAHLTATGNNGTTQTIEGDITFNADGTITVVVNGYEHTF